MWVTCRLSPYACLCVCADCNQSLINADNLLINLLNFPVELTSYSILFRYVAANMEWKVPVSELKKKFKELTGKKDGVIDYDSKCITLL